MQFEIIFFSPIYSDYIIGQLNINKLSRKQLHDNQKSRWETYEQ